MGEKLDSMDQERGKRTTHVVWMSAKAGGTYVNPWSESEEERKKQLSRARNPGKEGRSVESKGKGGKDALVFDRWGGKKEEDYQGSLVI